MPSAPGHLAPHAVIVRRAAPAFFGPAEPELSREALTMAYEISNQVLEEQYTAVVRGEVPATQLTDWLEDALGTVSQHLAAAGLAASGPPFARYTQLGDRTAIEAGYPVPHGVVGEGKVESSLLPAGPAAIVTHVGPRGELVAAREAVRAWLTEHGYEPAGPHWEIYRTHPDRDLDPAQLHTDVVMPYRNGPAPR